MRIFLSLLLFFFVSSANAGIYEVSLVYNFKQTNYDSTTYEKSESGTASLAYYFWGLSGLEFSFTRGASLLSQQHYFIYQDLTAYGASLLFTIANKESAFKPYLKGGASYIKKNIRYIYKSVGAPPAVTAEGLQPNIGIGFKVAIGPQFEIKTGVDASTSPLPTNAVGADTNPTYDLNFNIGLGFLF